MAEIEIRSERVDDIPLLIHQQRKMGIAEVVDSVISPHGNRRGLSVGEMIVGWISYILSEADHRMSEVEAWAAERRETLSVALGREVRGKDFTDDRLADALRWLGEEQCWEKVEKRLGQRLVRIYDLPCKQARVDSTSVAVYHEEEGKTLFRQGYSKDHRPDLAQFKVMMASLDPLGLPLGTLVVAGNEGDDNLYVPAIQKARAIVGQGGRLYIGDVKMSVVHTRAYIQEGGDYYLTPLQHTGDLRAWLEPVWKKEQPLQRVRRGEGSQGRMLALGYEVSREQRAWVKGGPRCWSERVLVIYSLSLARQTRRGLQERLQRAEEGLLALTPQPGKRRRQWHDLGALQKRAQTILKRRRVEGLLEVSYVQQKRQRQVRQYGDRPAREEEEVCYFLQVQRNPEAIRTAYLSAGWRLYVTNAPVEKLSLAEAVRAYRGASCIERNFRRLKGHPLGIRPLYVQREDHAKGMVRLLTLALRVLTTVEHVVRQQLQARGETLSGLYAAHPKQQTARPTTERLLRAFRGITLTTARLPDREIRHVSPLSELQQRILTLLDLPASIYQRLVPPIQSIPP